MSNISIIIFFVITASFGAGLLTYVLKDKKRPIYLVALHGLFAIASYGLLSYNVGMKVNHLRLTGEEHPLINYAYVFFSAAAVGGLYMLIRDKLLDKGIPKWLPFVHGGLAATGLIMLIIATITDK